MELWLRLQWLWPSKVLPVPGGPTINTPLGMVAPRRLNLAGSFKKSTISTTSCFASSQPATSVNVDFNLVFRQHFGFRLTKAHRAIFTTCTATHVAHKEHE